MNDLAGEMSILWPALVAGVLVVLSHVPLGQQVLRRGIVFIDLAIAQVAGLGVIAAHAFGMELQGWTTQAAAVLAASTARPAAPVASGCREPTRNATCTSDRVGSTTARPCGRPSGRRPGGRA